MLCDVTVEVESRLHMYRFLRSLPGTGSLTPDDDFKGWDRSCCASPVNCRIKLGTAGASACTRFKLLRASTGGLASNHSIVQMNTTNYIWSWTGRELKRYSLTKELDEKSNQAATDTS